MLWKPEYSRRLPPLLLVAGVGCLIDQWTKFLAVRDLTHVTGEASSWLRFWQGGHPLPTAPFTVIPGFWDFSYVENPGAAWGLLAGASESFRAPFFFAMSLFAMGLLSVMYLRTAEQFVFRRLAFALVCAGAAGNFIDRTRLSYVIDFIHWYWRDMHWPTFNVADAYISVAVVILFVESFFVKEES